MLIEFSEFVTQNPQMVTAHRIYYLNLLDSLSEYDIVTVIAITDTVLDTINSINLSNEGN